MRLRRLLLLLLVGCTAPLTIAKPRDAGPEVESVGTDAVAPPPVPSFGDAEPSDADAEIRIEDPPEDASTD